MYSRKEIIHLIVFILLLAIYAQLLFESSGYYDYRDLLGPLSKNPYITLVLVMLAIYPYFLLYSTKESNKTSLNLLLISTIPIFIKYFLPDLADVYYIENFYDASGHMLRGSFVTLTGHSDPAVDHYFGFQPGFFWATAVIVDVIAGVPNSFTSQTFSFLIKWFPMLAITVYIPLLYYLVRCFDLTPKQAAGALFFIFWISLDRYHYAAQTWGNALYWAMLILIYRYVKLRDIRYLYLVLIVLLSMVFVHQGVYIFAMVAILSILVVSLFPKLKFTSGSMKKLGRAFLIILLFQVALWQVNAFLLTNSYVDFKNAITYITREYGIQPRQSVTATHTISPTTSPQTKPPPVSISIPRAPSATQREPSLIHRFLQLIIKRVERAYKPWEDIVKVKALYFITLVLIPILVFLHEYKSRRGGYLKHVAAISFSIVLLTTAILGLIAMGLGGAGYVERIPLLLQPLIGVAMVYIFSLARNFGRYIKIFTIFLILIIASMGSVLYFSGRNFQSTTYSSGWNVRNFLQSIESPSIPPSKLYSFVRLPDCRSNSLQMRELCVIYPHTSTLLLYYQIGDPKLLGKLTEDIITKGQLIYSSGRSLLLHTPRT